MQAKEKVPQEKEVNKKDDKGCMNEAGVKRTKDKKRKPIQYKTIV